MKDTQIRRISDEFEKEHRRCKNSFNAHTFPVKMIFSVTPYKAATQKYSELISYDIFYRKKNVKKKILKKKILVSSAWKLYKYIF